MNSYECEKCNYKTVRKYNFDKHLNSKLHKKIFQSIPGNQNNTFVCLSCDKCFNRKYNFIRHTNICKSVNANNKTSTTNNIVSATLEQKTDISGAIKEQHDISLQNSSDKYICKICDFKSNKKRNYEIHLASKKHIQIANMITHTNPINENIIVSDNNYTNIETFKNEVITTLMTQLSSVLEENNKSVLAEQTKMNRMITEMANKPHASNITNNNNNHQTNNHHFNMNMFLNETCKDAMNMSEFIENLTVTMEDMEMTGTLGFAKGMSRIIMNNLNAIEFHKRPIHCSDAKRETLYVKNNGVWEKDTDDKKHTKELIYKVSSLNLKHLLKWRELPRNKGYDNPEHKKNDEFTILVMEINKVKVEEIEKVVTIISKNVTIDKNKVRMSGYLN